MIRTLIACFEALFFQGHKPLGYKPFRLLALVEPLTRLYKPGTHTGQFTTDLLITKNNLHPIRNEINEKKKTLDPDPKTLD